MAIRIFNIIETHSGCKQPSKEIITNEISDIFQPYENNDNSVIIPKFILIEGAPGMGKTTLCKEIAYKWAKKHLLDDTELLLLIYLRDPAISEIKNLTDLIHYFYHTDVEAKEWSKQYAQILTKSNSNLMVILDGYDEMDSSKQSFILKILNRDVLPNCRIVVTSRLTASDILHSKADVRVEVLGFTDESKDEYIKHELKDPDQIKKMLSYLNSHPSIRSVCYLPIMMTILIYIFKMEKKLPANPIELYDKFIALTISCHLQKQYLSQDLFVSLQSLPDECKVYLNDLSKFAFVTLKSNKIVFNTTDVKRLCPGSTLVNANVQNLGLINSVQYFSTDRGSVHVFNFLHLTIHEYLSAYYISSIDQTSLFNELEVTFFTERYKEIWKQAITLKKNYCLIFQNYSIYCKDLLRKVISNWMGDFVFSSLPESFLEFCNVMMNTGYKHVQLFLQNIKRKYLFQLPVYLSLCYSDYKLLDLYIFENNIEVNWLELGHRLAKDKNIALICIQNVNMWGFKANEQQLIKCFKDKISYSDILLQNCYITDKTLDTMMLHFEAIQHVQYFKLIDCSFEANGFNKLADILKTLKSMKHLNIHNCILTENTDVLTSVILSNANLQTLHFGNYHNEVCIKKVIEFILQKADLKKMAIANVTNNDIPLIGIFVNFNTSVMVIHLFHTNLKISYLQLLCKLSSLKVLYISIIQISQEVGKAISSLIIHNTGLEELYLIGSNISIRILSIAKALQHIAMLRIIELSNNDILQEVCDKLEFLVNSSKNFRILLHQKNMHFVVRVIINSLTTIKSLTKLSVETYQATQETSQPLASEIQHNIGLKESYPIDNYDDEGMMIVSQALQHFKTLSILNLSHKNMLKESSNKITIAVNSSKQLKEVRLYDDSYKSSITAILKSLGTISTLKVVNVTNHQICKQISEAIVSIMKNNTELEELLYFNSNNISLNISKALQHITALRVLDLGFNHIISQEAYDELALAIKSNKQLNKLWLPGSNLCCSVNVILDSLTTITTLTVLDLNNNQITQEACEALALVINQNTGLEELYLGNNNLGINNCESSSKHHDT